MNQHDLVATANQFTPTIYEATVHPTRVVNIVKDDCSFQGWKAKYVSSSDAVFGKPYGPGDSFILDFDNHVVGYLSMTIKVHGSPQDAPLRLKLTFGEVPLEFGKSFDSYRGWLSRAWLQDEVINVDTLPVEIRLPRRYSFRYVKIEIIDTSKKYKVIFDDIRCTTVTSGDVNKIFPLPVNMPEALKKMDTAGIKTLQDCMQSVFEDGPKRDRRLWIGDLRLQALANYYTFRNDDLVKRCLYLFAGLTLENGQVGACVFEKPNPLVDDTVLYDYSLFFVAILHDYYLYSHDHDVLKELWPTAWRQIELGLAELDNRGVVKDKSTWWCFVDWHPELNKQASAQAILIYCLKRALVLAKELQLVEEIRVIEDAIQVASSAAKQHLWQPELGFFVSGERNQVSWASQIWMVLAEILDLETNAQLLTRLFDRSPSIKPVTPYMYHHLIEALFVSKLSDRAVEEMNAYWGAMIKDGADCFWEVYNPSEPFLSPYDDSLINSYCHAWSCTPTYFIRKYLVRDLQKSSTTCPSY